MYDSRGSTPQSPVGQGARLGSGIGNRVSRLNPTPVQQRARGQEQLHSTHDTPSPPSHTARVLPYGEISSKSIHSKNQGNRRKNQGSDGNGKTGNNQKQETQIQKN